MISISKTAVLAGAVLVAGLGAFDFAQSGTDPSAATAISQRFPSAAETLLTSDITEGAIDRSLKGDRIPTRSEGCTREHWPYIADECMVRTESTKARRPNRTIVIERVAQAKPELTHVAAAQVASR